MQIKDHYADGSKAWGGYPWTQQSTALNVDFYGAYMRACLNGVFYDGGNWLYGGTKVTNDLWGCVGSWFSGNWYDSGARSYIAQVKQHLAERTWLKPGF
jgi:autotransporter family porin